MRRTRNRGLAIAGFAAAIAAGFVAVVTALGHEPPAGGVAAAAAERASQTVAFGAARVGRSTSPSGAVCYQLNRSGVRLARSCAPRLGDRELSYVLARRGTGQLVLAGVAGREVVAVLARLAPAGSRNATLRAGAFYAPIPRGYTVRAVEKVLRDGSRRLFRVEPRR
ncbi:MAG TPA: hypothetical protein VGJ77_21675 [Gaiellaceae bacterium]|jgi:hypothetical protein